MTLTQYLIGGTLGVGLTLGIEVGSIILLDRKNKRDSFKINILCKCSGMEVATDRLARKMPGYADTYNPNEVKGIAHHYSFCAQHANTKKIPKYLEEIWPRYVKAVEGLENQLKRHLPSFKGFIPESS